MVILGSLSPIDLTFQAFLKLVVVVVVVSAIVGSYYQST